MMASVSDRTNRVSHIISNKDPNLVTLLHALAILPSKQSSKERNTIHETRPRREPSRNIFRVIGIITIAPNSVITFGCIKHELYAIGKN